MIIFLCHNYICWKFPQKIFLNTTDYLVREEKHRKSTRTKKKNRQIKINILICMKIISLCILLIQFPSVSRAVNSSFWNENFIFLSVCIYLVCIFFEIKKFIPLLALMPLQSINRRNNSGKTVIYLLLKKKCQFFK